MAKTPNYIKHPTEYVSWTAMRQRCGVKSSPAKKGYETISVCLAWRLSFEHFLMDMGNAPSPEHTLDRKDNSLGYYKENCRWATPKEQANNRTNNVRYHLHTDSRGKAIARKYINGIRYTIGEFSSEAEAVKILGPR